jgi:dipeptidyl aminopeptidase
MAKADELTDEQSQPLTHHEDATLEPETPRRSFSSVSTTSLILENVSHKAAKESLYRDGPPQHEMDMDDQLAWQRSVKPADKKARRVLYGMIALGVVGWVAALFLFLGQDRHVAHSARPHDPHATSTIGSGKKVTLDQVLTGQWYANSHAIRWIAGTEEGEDGLLLERNGGVGRDYLVVEDVRYRGEAFDVQKENSKTLMKEGTFWVGQSEVRTHEAWPSSDHKKVLIQSDYEKLYRHSGFGRFWIFDVETQEGEPLDPGNVDGRVQAASWSPKGDAVVFTRDNNMFIRHLDSDVVQAITTDGGPNLFYGVPDWVYEEEVFAGASATWWAGDGNYVAFLRTDESKVPTFPVQYFFSRPSGKQPRPGEEKYPETSLIKYPKAGAPMSTVTLEIYDVARGETFEVPIDDDFENEDRLITEVVWAGKTGKLLVRSTNRESDVLKFILIDAPSRKGRIVRERDVQELDGGWFEISEMTTFVPNNRDQMAGRKKEFLREHDGYVDTVIHEGYDHLAYFTPLDNPKPRMLTTGKWEVVKAPAAIDDYWNLVYFIATKADSTERHLYSVDLNVGPESIKDVTEQNEIGYYDVSFSDKAGFMLLSYKGPDIPWQKIKSTPGEKRRITDVTIETNEQLAALARKTELPIEIYSTYNVDGFDLNVVERRPPHFDPKKKYPVLFYLYNGPGFQEVDRRFTVNFQSYVASTLGYIVVTVDGRGTGFLGREHRCIIRGNIGYWEAHDQIAVAKQFAAKKYVDADKIAIWGWSYGGFMTLKTLEMDAGETFKYGMAVAPVTDWRFYDSVYTERYMHTPQHNPGGYDNATISNMTALSQNVRFLVMHGYSDDNVHFQNTLQLLDKLDQAGVMNYDVHVFPDSDHSIYFHNANRIVYQSKHHSVQALYLYLLTCFAELSDWLVNAFNGEWLRMDKPTPNALGDVIQR